MIKRSTLLKKYFKQNGLRHISVNVDIAIYNLGKAFEATNAEDIIDNLNKMKNVNSLIVLYKYYDKIEHDNGSTYDFDNIRTTLDYISNHYRCLSSIKWLINLITVIDYYTRLKEQK
jgi:hypothetical protein